jgi:hypothetical protein
MSDAPLKECSACGKPDMKKKVSAAAFRLSGAGWYETDFKSGNKKNLSNNKSESKPADNNKAPKKEASSSCCSGGACANGSSSS